MSQSSVDKQGLPAEEETSSSALPTVDLHRKVLDQRVTSGLLMSHKGSNHNLGDSLNMQFPTQACVQSPHLSNLSMCPISPIA